MFRVAGCLKSTHVIPNIFPNDPLQIIPVHSWRLRICPEPAGIRCTPTARARAISQLLLQLRILLLKSLYLSLVKRPQILFSIPCLVDSLSPSQQASSDLGAWIRKYSHSFPPSCLYSADCLLCFQRPPTHLYLASHSHHPGSLPSRLNASSQESLFSSFD